MFTCGVLVLSVAGVVVVVEMCCSVSVKKGLVLAIGFWVLSFEASQGQYALDSFHRRREDDVGLWKGRYFPQLFKWKTGTRGAGGGTYTPPQLRARQILRDPGRRGGISK